MVKFLSMPQLQAPNALNTEPLSNALLNYGQTRRADEERAYNRRMAEENRAYQRGRDAKADARQGQADQQAKVDRLGKMALMYDRLTEPHLRQAGLDKILKEHPAAASLGPEYRDPTSAFKLIAAEAGQWRDPRADQAADLDLELKRAQVAKANRSDDPFADRARAAQGYGLDPNSDAGRSYILTGKMPREDQQALTATDKKAILEADEMVSVNRGAITALDEAMKLSPQANQGWLAGTRAALGNNLPDFMVPDFISSPESSQATSNLDNAVVGNALTQLKAIFGAAPTEGERKILLDLQGSAGQPHKVRMEIYARAKAAAEKRLAFNEDRARQLRGGTFYKPQANTGPQPAPSGLGGAPIRATNPQTGETIEWNGNQWVPVQ